VREPRVAVEQDDRLVLPERARYGWQLAVARVSSAIDWMSAAGHPFAELVVEKVVPMTACIQLVHQRAERLVIDLSRDAR